MNLVFISWAEGAEMSQSCLFFSPIMLLSNSQDIYAEESAHYARFFFLNKMPQSLVQCRLSGGFCTSHKEG